MAHFARLDKDNVVEQVIVIANEDILDENGEESEAVGIAFCKSLYGEDTKWAQTSYNSNIRFRYAGIGAIYDERLDGFYEPQPFPSWILNARTWRWEPPVLYPDDIKDSDPRMPPVLEGGVVLIRRFTDDGRYRTYRWDEATISWAFVSEIPSADPDRWLAETARRRGQS